MNTNKEKIEKMDLELGTGFAGCGIICCILLSTLIIIPTSIDVIDPDFFTRTGSLSQAKIEKWRSADGNARIVYSSKGGLTEEWRPATEEELYEYKEEFPRRIDGFIYAGASLIYGEDPKTGMKIPYVLGYAQTINYFFADLIELDQLKDPMHLVIKKSTLLKGRLEYSRGKVEKIGGFEIPPLPKKDG